MKRTLFCIIFIFIFLPCSFAGPQDISISASIDKEEICVDEEISLTIVVSGSISNIPEPTIPDLGGFGYYSSGRSQNISIINSKVSSSVSFNYVLVPNSAGEHTLGPFTIEYKGNTYSTGSIKVNVLPEKAKKSTVSSKYTYPEDSGTSNPEPDPRNKGRELFITTAIDKNSAYVNEQITLTFSFYQSVDLFENPRYSPPDTTGFWTEDMPPQNKYYKAINGTRYLVTEIKTALFATSPGQFTIGPATLEASVEDVERFISRSPFSVFDRDPFSIFRRGKPIVLRTEPIEVNVLSLPDESKPIGFKGDVGRFDLKAAIDKEKITQNEPVTLNMKVEGKGNIKTISSPFIPELDNVKSYDSGSSENISKDNYIVQGNKTFEKMIIPKKEGKLSIGPIEYSYFDPYEKRYVEKKIGPINIEVEKTEGSEPDTISTPMAPGLTKEEIKIFKKDISYIKVHPSPFTSQKRTLYKNKIFIAIDLSALLLYIILLTLSLYRERLKKDIGYARSRSAKRIASARLKKARQFLTKGSTKDFYSEIYKAVIEYIAGKLNIPNGSITKRLLEETLIKRGLSNEAINDIGELFDLCDMARFASGKFTKEDMANTVEKAIYIIGELEKIKKG
ncbi:MAG: BatD family protein [Candidatus Omnitrophota bacterium]